MGRDRQGVRFPAELLADSTVRPDFGYGMAAGTEAGRTIANNEEGAVSDTDVAVLGAGPYGLTVAAHLRQAGVDVRILGDPMSFWSGMPKGMLLRSSWRATCIAAPDGPLSLESYRDAAGRQVDRPVPLASFIDYGMWVQQQVAPELDRGWSRPWIAIRADSAWPWRTALRLPHAG